ncbi:hypothetical protein PLICRDRAFT_516898 [Plicaturopsis crispa FD-325 SS-3]|nr:hypothetical protein PLICRDRAFT_516898 [Plicaturopsis crispa FD-325 SS-3]
MFSNTSIPDVVAVLGVTRRRYPEIISKYIVRKCGRRTLLTCAFLSSPRSKQTKINERRPHFMLRCVSIR